jgi:uncharacterized protein (DUF697 family)
MSTSDTEVALGLENKLTAAARAERLVSARSLTKNYVLAAAGIGLIPVPLVDLAALVGLQVKLVHGLAKHYDVPFKENIAKSLVASLLSGVSGVVGVAGLASLAKAVPGLGTLAGGGGVAITAASITYATGEVFTRHFESGGTLLDFDPHKVKEFFKCELKKGKAAAADAVAEATPAESAAPPAAAA